MKYSILPAICLFGTVFNVSAQSAADYVNTRQGSNSTFAMSRGNDYPAIALPFGMHTWTPQNGVNGDGWKYQYAKDSIRGFEQSHQCSPWTRDYAVFSLMPVAGKPEVNQFRRAAKFSHSNEIAHAHYYKVKLDNGITTEITPTERGAVLRFHFSGAKKNFIVLDGYIDASAVHISSDHRSLTGFVRNGFAFPKEAHSFFVVQFDRPFTSFGTWDNTTDSLNPGSTDAEGKGKGAYVGFDAGTVTVKTASSYISPQQALLTLKTEIGEKSFDQVKGEAGAIWNKTLGNARAEGGSEEQLKTYYSCLYRASLNSREFFEIDSSGKPYYYSPYDMKIHNGYMYTDNGFWDTFRAEFPLHNLLYPTVQGRYMNALLSAYDQCGWLPSWSFPSETGGMVGNHSMSLLADAWMKGIHSFDPAKALAAYYHEATNKGPWGGANGRPGSKEYFSLGYVPYPGYGGATGATLEYAYDDFCAWQLARVTGNKFYEDIFARQMFNYKNVYDSATQFMRARNADGTFDKNFDEDEWGGAFTEGNAWHYAFTVFHDQQGLMNLMGGEKKYSVKLDSLFTAPNRVNVGSYKSMIHEMAEMVRLNTGQFAISNQPAQHMSYLYDYCRQPWKTQYWTRLAMDSFFRSDENGFPGDEDQGQTSAWYVLSAMGLYAVCPGTDQYVIGSPLFKKLTLTLENGKQFVIEAPDNAPGKRYIRTATLNGQPFTRNWIGMTEIQNGGVLRFDMSATPETTRGITDADKPFSLSPAAVSAN